MAGRSDLAVYNNVDAPLLRLRLGGAIIDEGRGVRGPAGPQRLCGAADIPERARGEAPAEACFGQNGCRRGGVAVWGWRGGSGRAARLAGF